MHGAGDRAANTKAAWSNSEEDMAQQFQDIANYGVVEVHDFSNYKLHYCFSKFASKLLEIRIFINIVFGDGSPRFTISKQCRSLRCAAFSVRRTS